MIDTLRFANRLKQSGLTDQQSEAFAEAWAEQARDDLPSRSDMIALDGKIDRLDGKVDRLVGRIESAFHPLMDRLRRKLDKLTWMVGFTLAGVVAVIVRLLSVG